MRHAIETFGQLTSLQLRVTACLVIAGLVVALAIALDDGGRRAVNGVGGMIWIASAAVLIWTVRREPRWGWWLAGSVALTFALSWVFPPSTVVPAIAGFGLAGALVGAVGPRTLVWAAMVPAVWLPVHLVSAALRAGADRLVGSPTQVRTDPPPTAALVPELMILAALAGGAIVLAARDYGAGRAGHASVAGEAGVARERPSQRVRPLEK